MKKLLLTTMIVTAFIVNIETKAQLNVQLHVNTGGRPNWGLPGNYAGDYYYLPEIDSYYDIPHQRFIYFEGSGWVFASALPYRFRDYDLFRGFKAVINEPMPYQHSQLYRNRYSRYYNTYRAPILMARTYPNNRYHNNRNEHYRNDHHSYNLGKGNQPYENQRRDEGRNDRDNRGRNEERNRDNDHGRSRGKG